MKCFVAMPFGTDQKSKEQFGYIFDHCIQPAVERLNDPGGPVIQCRRGDSEYQSGEVMVQVIEQLAEADFVIADLTGQNPNVFYELGVRHALRNNTILIAQDFKEVPFDLQGQRRISYRYDPPGLLRLQADLQKALRHMLSAPTPIDNPVLRCLQDREVARAGSSTDGAVKRLSAELQDLRKELADRVTEIRALVQNTTSTPQDTSHSSSDFATALQGAWTTLEHGGLYVFLRVGQELRGPYCYDSDDHLTAHFFNIQILGQQVLCRFRWIEGAVEGCALFTVVSRDLLVGGWWYLYELPRLARQDLSRLHAKLPSMNPLRLERIPMPKPMPGWVSAYYEKAERGEI